MIRYKVICFCFLCGLSSFGYSQVTDDFSDGDFITSPTWTGSSSFGVDDPFEISEADNQLRSQNLDMGSGTRLLYLSTANNMDLSSSTAEWGFRFRLGFSQPGSASTNSNNTSRVYLMSNSSNLNGDLNGYYVELRYPDSDVNEVRLFRQDGSSTTELSLSGSIQQLTSQDFVNVTVSRSETGLWELEVNSISQGTTTDNTYSSSSFFGVQVRYTANSRDNGFYFDDFSGQVTPVADTSPPTIQSVTAISDTQLDVQFSEPVDETTSEVAGNYSIDGGISVSSADRDISNTSLVHLAIDPLTNGTIYTLTINNIEDENGNAIVDNSEEMFEYLVFEEATELDIVINEFMAAPSVESGLPNEEYVEIYNRSDKFVNLENWTISDAAGPSSGFPSTTLRPGEYLILTSTGNGALFSGFGDVLEVASFPALNNSGDDIVLANSLATVIHQIDYQDSENGVSTELINPDDPCLSIDSYALSVDASGGTPGSQNSIFDSTPDTTPPTITSSSFTTSLIINFSEIMDATSLASGSYIISAGLTIDEILVEEQFPTSVEITFNETVELGNSYKITIADVSDCSGNTLAETTISFSFGRAPVFNELIITEIYADEDPSVGLPEREWIEIFNATEDVISTEGMTLTDATNTVDLPSFNIEPNAYIILTSNNGASEFANATGVSGYFSNSLNNSGESLVLAHNSALIFSVAYTPDWHDDDKRDGGYSLEMVDITNPCLESGANWRSSTDVSGGTPGRENSVNNPGSVPDNMPPSLIRVTAISDDTVKLVFDEKIDPASTQNATFNFNPNLEIVESFVLADKPRSVYVKLSSELEVDVPYTLQVSGISDCNGNEIGENEQLFALPVNAENDEIKLSEVLFNPRTNGVDFVEIYNDSEKFISLKEWQLARKTDDTVEEERIISNEELVVEPGEYLVFTSDANILLSNYPKGHAENFIEMTSLPSYPNEEGIVLILDENSEIKEEFTYKEDFHYDLLESVDGVSLERVSFSQPNNEDNWRSAASTEGFATPGYLNSQSFSSDVSSGKVSADPEVFIPGNAGTGRDFTTINYQLDEPGQFANVNIYDQTGRLVKNLAQGVLLSTSGFLRWDGDTNDGKMARMGYYLIIFEIYDSKGNSETIKETVVVGRDF
ncbi:lamin tail domain-containing protein [Ekhidna sp. MALMAid0563]|uniref:lamin tail domain-containing protein n=1 Tax=Ekhidna sp. MALMAid0563 TaxID=3143937 RepID=UPI0032E0085F